MQSIALTIECEKRLFYKMRDGLRVKPASSPATIKQFMSQGLRPVDSFQPFQSFSGQAVRKPESHKLDDVLRIKMRQVMAGMPTFMLHGLRLTALEKTRHWSGAPPAKPAPRSA